MVSDEVRSNVANVLADGLAFPLTNALTPNVPLRALKLNDPFSILVPAVADKFPLIPCAEFFFRMILIMPPNPCASYLAPGLVITSTLFTWLAGMDCNTSAMLFPKAEDGFPLIKNRILELPDN